MLFGGQSHRAKKFVLHTNVPGHFDFGMYTKCFFELSVPVLVSAAGALAERETAPALAPDPVLAPAPASAPVPVPAGAPVPLAASPKASKKGAKGKGTPPMSTPPLPDAATTASPRLGYLGADADDPGSLWHASLVVPHGVSDRGRRTGSKYSLPPVPPAR